MGGRLDRFRDWRLDVDNMSYEVIVRKPIRFFFLKFEYVLGYLKLVMPAFLIYMLS